MNETARALDARLRTREAAIGVIGLGYVGLPLSLTCCEKGFAVLGFDIDESKPTLLNRGESYIEHLDGGRTRAAVDSGRFSATADFSRLGEPDVLVICVPTPLTPQREPDTSFIAATGRQIARTLRPGQLVILESTTYPGTTDELLKGILEEGRLVAGEDFFLAYSPEREDPGNRRFSTGSIPKVVGGSDPVSGDLAQTFYDQVVERTVRVSGTRAAEATKLTENVFRAVNIALVNELKMIYDRMGIDIWEVLDAADTKPFGFMRFNPGPGWGGHCIPVDPFYLSWKAREFGLVPHFIERAGEVNVGMPDFVMTKVTEALNRRGKALRGARVLVLGLAYKRDVADVRESPAFVLIERLLQAGAEVRYHDPHLPLAPRTRSWPELAEMRSTPLTRETLAASDAVLLVTDHSDVDYQLVAAHAPVIVDTRGVYRDGPDNVVKA